MFPIIVAVIVLPSFLEAYPLTPCPSQWDSSPCRCIEGLPEPTLNCSDPSTTVDDLKAVFQRLPYFVTFQKLVLQNTKVESLSQGLFGNATFKSATFENNLLHTVEKDAFKGFEEKIEYIIFKGNRLSHFDFRSTHNMRGLYMITITDDLALTEIPDDAFADNPRLTSIYLQRNRIETIGKRAFASIPHVVNIDLYENKIRKLDEYSLSVPVNKGLSRPLVNLTDNMLSAPLIHPTAFEKLTPQWLDIKNNRLELFPRMVFKNVLDFQDYAYPALFITEGKIDVTGNTFVCNHMLQWLVEKSSDYKAHIVGLKCTNGKALEDLTVDDLH